MADVTISPNMSLPVPTLADVGPDYANNVNQSLNTIDGHTHTGAPTDGLQLDLSKQSNTADVQLNDNDLGTTRSVEFVSQPGTLTGTQDVNCLYVRAGVLGFNDSGGTFIPLTTGATAPVTNNFSAVTVSTNHVILSTDAINFVGCDSTAGTILITLPRASTILPTPAWRYYLIKDVSGAASTHTITIQVTGGSGDTFAVTGDPSITISTALAWVGVFTDGVSLWYVHDTSTFNVGDTLHLNSATLKLTSAFIRGTATPTGLTLSGDASISLAASTIALSAGSTFSLNASSTATIGAPIGAASGESVTLKAQTVTPNVTTGSYVLTTTDYNAPVIVLGAIGLTGNLLLEFPPTVGSVWIIDGAAVTLNGHAITASTSHAGAVSVTLTTGAAASGMIVCTTLTRLVLISAD